MFKYVNRHYRKTRCVDYIMINIGKKSMYGTTVSSDTQYGLALKYSSTGTVIAPPK